MDQVDDTLGDNLDEGLEELVNLIENFGNADGADQDDSKLTGSVPESNSESEQSDQTDGPFFTDVGEFDEEQYGMPVIDPARLSDRGLPEAEQLLRDVLEHRGWGIREGQLTMVQEVSETIQDSNTNRGAVIDAPVGTGKSLGYLLAALPTNHRIVVCTSTKALQDQLTSTELPRLTDDLKELYGYDLTYSVLKGRSNYLCMNAARQYASGGTVSGDDDDDGIFGAELDEGTKAEATKKVEELIARTEKAMEEGIISDLDCSDGLNGLPRAVSSAITSARKCGTRSAPWTEEEEGDLFGSGERRALPLQQVACESTCAYRRAYADGIKADIVVMNTSLLAAELIKSKAVSSPYLPAQLPGTGVIIVDEAHHLDRILTDALRLHLEFGGIYEMTEKWFRKLITRRKDMESRLGTWKTVLDSHYERLEEVVEETRPSRVLRVVSKELLTLVGELIQLLEGVDRPAPDIEPHILKSISRIVRSLDEDVFKPIKEVAFSIMEKVVNEDGKKEDVYDVTFSGGDEESYLMINATPLDLSFVREDLANIMDRPNAFLSSSGISTPPVKNGALILCSGTITNEASSTIGMTEARYKRVPSPFDPSRARVCVPTSISEPNSQTWREEAWQTAREAIIATGGKTLFLTTSHSNLTYFRDRALDDAEIAELGIVYQGMGTRAQVIEEFVRRESSILLGTTSFWEGIDVPGSALSLVIMDKIMFPMRDDPIFSARKKFVEKHHPGESFTRVDSNHAAIMLAQGAGRLIRAESDLGGIMILDKRLMQKFYGADVLKLLPSENKITTNKDVFIEWMNFVRDSTGQDDVVIPEADPRIYRPIQQKRPRRGRSRRSS